MPVVQLERRIILLIRRFCLKALKICMENLLTRANPSPLLSLRMDFTALINFLVSLVKNVNNNDKYVKPRSAAT